jgi:hypothetical protein
MYIDAIQLENFRTFRQSKIAFIHNGQDFAAMFQEFDLPEIPAPRFPNVNLFLGNNGSGKTALLKAIALTALGPAVVNAGIFPYRLIRREPIPMTTRRKSAASAERAILSAGFTTHEQDKTAADSKLVSSLGISRRGDLEIIEWLSADKGPWDPIFSTQSDAFFFVGYGATRRVERKESVDLGSRRSSAFSRAQRVQSLFEEAYSLIPLNAWLPALKHSNPGRYTQAVHLINRLTGEGHGEFEGEMEEEEFLFNRGGLKIPFPALSDGYRAFLGWVGDLTYHVCMTCPKGKKLVDNKGIVMVDEIDLHLHPKWQMTVLPTLAKELPNVQFIVTSHSPLIVGSLEWMNIILMVPGAGQSSLAKRLKSAVHGLDADQILLSDFFGLESSRAEGKKRLLKELSLQAREGDTEAAKRLMQEMSRGMEMPK